MITNEKLQESWISWLKANSAIVAELSTVNEIREDSWMGTDFVYPNIRVRIDGITPDMNPECSRGDATASIIVFSESKSSKEADRIAGVIANQIHGKSFTRTLDGGSQVRFSSNIVDRIVAASPEGELTWRATVIVRSLVS